MVAGSVRFWFLAASACVMGPVTARANNGLNFIGSGLESFAMGGADIAVSRDPLALDANPAGLAWQRQLAIEQDFAVAHAIDVGFIDELNPDQTVTNKYAPIGNGGITIPLENVPVTLSHGLFVAGGSGGAFTNVATPFGTNDDLSAKFGIVKTTIGGGAQVTDKFSFGLGGSLYYARLDQKVFPGTSAANPVDPAHTFFGTYLRGATGISGGAVVGLQYRATEWLTLGAIYDSKVNLPLSTDYLIVNAGAVGLGQVRYHSAHLSGLAEPQEIGVGVAAHVTDHLLLDVDVKWLDWRGALKRSILNASETDNPAAAPTVSLPSNLGWHNQIVVAVGAAFDLTPDTVLWAGYNYGNDPIPAATLNPLLAAIGEHHFTAGVGMHVSENITLGASLEYLLPTRAQSTDADFPLSTSLRVSTGYLAAHAGLRWVWQ